MSHDKDVQAAAATWFARMRAPDAESSRPAFDAWRAADDAHAEAYDRLLRRWDQTAFLAGTAVGRARDLRRPNPTFRRQAVAASAVVVLAAGGGLLAMKWSSPSPIRVEYANVGSAARAIALADGSRAILAGNAALSVGYTPQSRELWLRSGRARFVVAHDGRRGFVVHADGGSVTAHGTVFDVDVLRPGMRVALLQGTVEVRDETGSGGHVVLRPGDAVLLDADHRLRPVKPDDHAKRAAAQDMVTFTNARLIDAAAALNADNAEQTIDIDPAVADLRVTGAFHRSDSRGFVQSAAAMFDLRIDASRPHRLVLLPARK